MCAGGTERWMNAALDIMEVWSDRGALQAYRRGSMEKWIAGGIAGVLTWRHVGMELWRRAIVVQTWMHGGMGL